MLVTVDTNILIWGVRGISTAGQESMIERSNALIKWLAQQGHKLALTSQVVSEYFVGDISDDDRAAEAKVLTSRFPILPYDASAAIIAARLRSDPSFVKSLGQDAGKSRACVKADVVIVATAAAGGVDRIYTHDSDIKALALRQGISVSDLPDAASYSSLSDLPKTTPPAKIKSLFDDPGVDWGLPS